MPVKVNIGLSKKVGLPDYGSLGASAHVEFELDGGYDNGSTESFQDAVRRAYAACRQAVEAELTVKEQCPGPQSRGQHQSLATNRVANQTNPGIQTRGATTSQVRAIYAIANRNGVALAGVLIQFNVTRPDDLSIRDASSLIDQLKNQSGSPAVAQ